MAAERILTRTFSRFVYVDWHLSLRTVVHGFHKDACCWGLSFCEVVWQDVLPVAASTLVLIIYALQPLFTLKMSVDDSSFYGLLLVAVSLIMVHFVVERDHWILPFFRRNSKVSNPSNRG